MVAHWQDGLAIRAGWTARNTKHPRLTGAVNIGIQKPHTSPFGGKGAGEVGRHGGFAHTALAAGNGDDVLDPRHPFRALRLSLFLRLEVGRGLGAVCSQNSRDLGRSKRFYGVFGRIANRLICLCLGWINFQNEAHRARIYGQAACDSSRDNIGTTYRVRDVFQRFKNALSCQCHGQPCPLMTPVTSCSISKPSTVSTTLALNSRPSRSPASRRPSSMACCEVTPTCLRNLRMDMLKSPISSLISSSFLQDCCRRCLCLFTLDAMRQIFVPLIFGLILPFVAGKT